MKNNTIYFSSFAHEASVDTTGDKISGEEKKLKEEIESFCQIYLFWNISRLGLKS